jgi:hypothetical protein
MPADTSRPSTPRPQPAVKVRAILAPEEETDPMRRRAVLAGLTGLAGTTVFSAVSDRVVPPNDSVGVLESALFDPPSAAGMPVALPRLRAEVVAAQVTTRPRLDYCRPGTAGCLRQRGRPDPGHRAPRVVHRAAPRRPGRDRAAACSRHRHSPRTPTPARTGIPVGVWVIVVHRGIHSGRACLSRTASIRSAHWHARLRGGR